MGLRGDLKEWFFVLRMTMKQCSKCKQVKSLTEFWRDASKTDRYRSQCKKCREEYREVNHEQIIERGRGWRQLNRNYWREWSNAHPGYYSTEKCKEQKRVWARNWYTSNKEEKDNQIKQWRSNNPDRVNQWSRDRRARKAQAEGTFTDEQFQELCRCASGCCLCCGAITNLVPDHVIPLSRDGANDISNIQPLCIPCNSRKGVQSTDYRKETQCR